MRAAGGRLGVWEEAGGHTHMNTSLDCSTVDPSSGASKLVTVCVAPLGPGEILRSPKSFRSWGAAVSRCTGGYGSGRSTYNASDSRLGLQRSSLR
jgi:hypothetical protein